MSTCLIYFATSQSSNYPIVLTRLDGPLPRSKTCISAGNRLRVFENRILRRILWPKSDENGEWRRPHNEELHSLYRSPNIVRVNKSRRLRWAGRSRSAFKILTGKPTGKMPLGRPRYRWEDNIRMDLEEKLG